jgi:hypothetical protein
VFVVLLLAGTAAAGTVGEAHAQELRGTLQTTARYTELRPLATDSVDRALVTELEDGRFTFQGEPIYCIAGDSCIRYRAADVEEATAVTQYASFTAWGLGVQGLSVTASARGRGRFGGDFVWPRSDDEFDLILAYADLVRDRFRVRAGRQHVFSGLGRTAFDGVSGRLRVVDRWTVEGYGGRSLALGLNEPRTEALRSVEDFLPDQTVWLMGASVDGEIAGAVDLTLRYQREIFADRSGLVSERASADIRAYPFDRIRLDASVDWDGGLNRLGKANVSLLLPLDDGRFSLEAMARRYLPYFELWTVWGFFDPVPYHEVELRGSWRPDPALSVWASGALRWYGDPETITLFEPLEDRGSRGRLGGLWTPSSALTVEGSYRLEWGAGAFLNGGDVRARWQVAEPLGLALHGTALQQIEEFRLGDGTTLGAGVDVDWTVADRFLWQGGATLFRNTWQNRPGQPDWNQLRMWTGLTVTVGGDPGLGRVRP